MPVLFKISARKNRSVRDAITNRRWILDLRGRVTTEILHEFVELWNRVNANSLSNSDDSFSWRFSSCGAYSASSAYAIQFLGAANSGFSKDVWSIRRPRSAGSFSGSSRTGEF